MISFIQSLPKHFMTALRNLGRHMAMTLSSASAVAVTLTLMTLFLVLAANMNSFADHVETNLKIHASIDSLQKQDEIEHMEKLIKGISLQGTQSDAECIHRGGGEGNRYSSDYKNIKQHGRY